MSKKPRTNKKQLAREVRELQGLVGKYTMCFQNAEKRNNELSQVIKLQSETIEEQRQKIMALESGEVETVRLVSKFCEDISEEYQQNSMSRQMGDYLRQYMTFTVMGERNTTRYDPIHRKCLPVKYIVAEIKVVKP